MAPLTLITIFLLRWFLLTSVFVHQVTFSRNYDKIEILLSHFSNAGNKIASTGECCDGRKNASFCSDGCDTYFAVCIAGPIPGIKPCLFQNHSRIFTNGSDFHSTSNASALQPNPVNLVSINNLLFWPPNISFTLILYDDDSGETFKNNKTSEIIIMHTFVSAILSSRVWLSRNYSENGIAFQYLYRLTCAQDYYGENCNVYCRARNGIFSGYWMCLSNGTKVCLPGYAGHRCQKAICSPSCGRHGTCTAPNDCSCFGGWTGAKCQRCIPNAKCVHGRCKKPGGCICKKQWTGQNCDVYVNYCHRYHPCKNNAECRNDAVRNYTCKCTSDFEGTNCEKFRCPAKCNLTNANCSARIGCKCHSGWKGPNCHQCTTHPNCTNGYCSKPFECICLEGWTGTLCNVSKKWLEACSKDRPCHNNSICKPSLNGTNQCVCKDGFSGGHCENVLCSPTCNKTRGYCHTQNGCICHPGWAGPDCNQCIKNETCTNGHCTKPFECICNKDWTGVSCNISENSICSLTCNKTRGICRENNQCSCLPGWEGAGCNQCLNNSICKKGYCIKPFECICFEGWSGELCNITSFPQKNQTSSSPRAKDKTYFTTVAISVSAGLLVCVIFICALFMLWRNLRRRKRFCVTTPESFVNNTFKQSYTHGDAKCIENLNNNVGGLSNLSELQSTEIIMNPMNTSVSEDNQRNGSGLTLSTDSGFDDQGVLQNACAEY